jgi:hypothetical protein
MDPESQKRFDELTSVEPAALEPADVAFLRARSSYLTGDQRETYAEVLAEGEKGPYEGLSLKKLKAMVKDRDIEVATDATAEDIVAALVAADEAAQ